MVLRFTKAFSFQKKNKQDIQGAAAKQKKGGEGDRKNCHDPDHPRGSVKGDWIRILVFDLQINVLLEFSFWYGVQRIRTWDTGYRVWNLGHGDMGVSGDVFKRASCMQHGMAWQGSRA